MTGYVVALPPPASPPPSAASGNQTFRYRQSSEVDVRAVNALEPCMHAGEYLVAARSPLQDSAGVWGARHRNSPIGGSANGTPRKAATPSSVSEPFSVPLSTLSVTEFDACAKLTRRSTSGGRALLGSHHAKTWSSTRTSVALSSGEAEFSGVVKSASVGIGMKALGQDLNYERELVIGTDSSAALSMTKRSGLGKVRHLAVADLRI